MREKRPILIQGAMNVEVSYLLRAGIHYSQTEIDGYIFHTCTLNNFPVIVSETQIGSINSTIATTLGILEYNPQIVINQGIAGAYGKEIHKCDVVFGTEVINTNSYKAQKKIEGEGSNPLDWELITFTSDDDEEKKQTKLEADKELLNIAKEINFAKGKTHFGIIGSGDMWNKETDRIMWIKEHTGAICADMESIGAYTVCNKLNVPILGIRVMSDNEILNEEYDRETAIEAQKITLEFVKKYIEKG